jgi:hypothetical protein
MEVHIMSMGRKLGKLLELDGSVKAEKSGGSGGSGSAPLRVNFTATAGQTTKTGLTYTVGNIDCYLNGAKIRLDTDFTASDGVSVTFTPALDIGAEIELIMGATGGGSGGVTVYADLIALSAAVGTAGDMALVQDINKMFVYTGTGWFLIATVTNGTPSAISGVAGSYSLLPDGTATVITAASTDPEGFPLTWSYSVTTGSLGSTATVTQADNVFTITPSTDEANAGTFGITFSVTDGATGLVTQVSSFKLEFELVDSKYTVLMMNASNTGSNHTFSDASNSNHSISINGSPTASTLSAYRHGGYSVNFAAGTGDGLGINSTNSTVNLITTGDFTIECWAYSNVNANKYIFDMYNPRLSIFYETSGTGAPDNSFGAYDTGYRGAAGSQNGGIANRWIHVAMVRNSGTITVYNDGIAVFSWVTNANFSNSGICIGGNSPSRTWNAPVAWDGYIQDFRIIDGTALYTTTFTPPTEILTAVAGTTLLTCQGPSFSDKSSNAYALENGGSASIDSFNKFDHRPYSQGVNGASVYFDGTTDYLQSAANSDFQFGTGDFTVEVWAYFEALPTESVLLSKWNAGGIAGTNQWLFYMVNSAPYFVWSTDGVTNPNAGVTGPNLALNGWHHLAVVRNGSSITLYVNGVPGTSISESGSLYGSETELLGIGYRRDNNSGTSRFTGYMSDIRIVKGIAVYTAAFTPPTAPLTTIADTKFLLNPETSISDLSQTSLLKTFGSTVTSSSQVKFAGTRSVYFDGVGDYLTAASPATMGIGTGDFTIECWFYATDGAIDVGVWDTHSQSSSSDGLTLTRITATTFRVWDSSQILVSSATAITDNWNHLAVVRNGGTLELFVNGVSQGTVSNSTNMNSAQEIMIGAGRYSNTAAPTAFVKGYMQDFRITKGLARYTTNFTPSQIGELLG